LREDYLAQLESLKRYLPSIKDSRFRVVQMTGITSYGRCNETGKNLIEKRCRRRDHQEITGILRSILKLRLQNWEIVKRFVVEPFIKPHLL
jgi:hypothetical protein